MTPSIATDTSGSRDTRPDMISPHTAPRPPYPIVTPRLHGSLKTVPADFLVEELPAYLPSGTGEHLFLWIEKTDLSAELLVKHVARTLDLPQGEIGTAGMKDRRAITRQWVSVPARRCPDPGVLNSDHVRVLEQGLHGNKLRTGHLQGNRFTIRIRDLSWDQDSEPTPLDPARLAEIVTGWTPAIDQLRRYGFANYYGDQRFGRDGETLQLGYDLLTRTRTPRDIPYARRKFLLKLALSSVQSDLFNQALARRIAEGLIETVLPGDVMEVTVSGGKFVVEDAAAEQARFLAGETTLTGPIFGLKMKTPDGAVAGREQAVLDDAGLTLDAFDGFGDLLSGTRRAYLVKPEGFAVTIEEGCLVFEFTLPAGAYATTLLELFVEPRASA
jgi:tRNA pseudouridine13 synthase